MTFEEIRQWQTPEPHTRSAANLDKGRTHRHGTILRQSFMNCELTMKNLRVNDEKLLTVDKPCAIAHRRTRLLKVISLPKSKQNCPLKLER
jgi:hypothetical protein